jgi:hypothetical protein
MRGFVRLMAMQGRQITALQKQSDLPPDGKPESCASALQDPKLTSRSTYV